MSRARDLAKLGNINVLSGDDISNEVGIASTVPRSTLDVRGELQVGTAIKAGPAGVLTATSFDGGTSGNVTGAACTFTTGTFNGNVTIGGTLTYEDVTNIDSLGIVTARAGVNVSGGQLQVGVAYSVGAAGVATAAGFVGPLTGNVTGSQSGGSVSATTGTFSQKTTVNATLEATEGLNVTAGVTTIGGNVKVGSACTITTGAVLSLQANSAPQIQLLDNNNGFDATQLLVENGGRDFKVTVPQDTIFTQGSTESMRLTSSGALGIGTLGDSTGPTSLLVARNEASGYIASFRGVHTSNSAQIIIDSPADNNTRPSSIDLANAGVVKWSLGQAYASASSGAFHIATSKLQSNDDGAKVTVSTGGLVGIGTNIPDCNMHVMKASAGSMSADGNAVLALENSNHCVLNMMTPNDKSCYIMMGDPDDSNAGQIRYDNNINALTIDVNGGEKARVDSSGLVQIGQTSPYSATGGGNSILTAALSNTNRTDLVVSNQNSGNNAGAALVLAAHGQDFILESTGSGNSATGAGVFTISDGASERLRINGSGLVGIASTNPQTTLHIQEASEPTVSLWEGGTKRSAFQAASSGTYLYSYQDNPLIFSSASGVSFSEKLRIGAEGLFSFNNGELVERVNITAGKLSDNTNINLSSGMVHYFTTQESTTSTPNIRSSASATLNSLMDAGDVITVTLVTTAAAGGYSANVTIDGNAVTEEWVGGSAPSAGGSDGLDIYVYTIICTHATNTGDSGFKVIANYVNATN